MNNQGLKCYVCNSEKLQHIETRNPQYWTEYGSQIFSDRQIYFCNACHFSFSYPFVPKDKLDRFYSIDFPKRRASNAFEGPNLSTLLKTMLAKQYINFDSVNKILEIGAANPYSLKSLVNHGIKSNLYSIESMDVDKKPFLKEGIEVINCDLTLDNVFKTTEEKMDLIFSNHVLEHFNANDLDNVLKNINGFMNINGLFVFDLPNDDMASYIEKGIRNQGCHLVHYTKKSMTIHLERMGFKVLYCEATGTERNHDNYSYPEIPHEETSEIIYQDLKLKKQNFTSFLKKILPIKVLFLLRKLRDSLVKENNLYQYLIQENAQFNPNGQNLKICAKKISNV